MAVTLIESAKTQTDDLRRSVIEIYGRSTPLMAEFLFQNIGGSAISFLQEGTPGDIEFRNVNEGYAEDAGTLSRLTEPLLISGGDVDVDTYIVETNGSNIRAQQEAMKLKRMGHLFSQKVIKGDQATNNAEFNGLQSRMTGSNLLDNGGGGLSLTKLDEAIDQVPGATHIIMNQTVARYFKAATRTPGTNNLPIAGHVEYTVNSLGETVPKWGGLPFIILDDNSSLYSHLPFTETGSTTSVYVVNLSAGGFTGIQSSAPMARDLGEIDTKPVMRTRVEWFAGVSLWHKYGACRLANIDDASIAT